MKIYLNYIRLLLLGIFILLLLEQQFDIYSQISIIYKTITKGKDFISSKDQSYKPIRDILPPKGAYRYESDVTSNPSEFTMFYYIAQYSLAPRVLIDSLHTDTVVANFYKTGSIDNPQNPLYATRSQWTVLSNNGTGIMLLKKNK